ncbi:2-methyl-aconitate isomerase [Fusarium oxysporum f. sp. albedinis]|nr:2-methyl-aconitate isomerase [Fusarium oxysporum f. sp. albedinis]
MGQGVCALLPVHNPQRSLESPICLDASGRPEAIRSSTIHHTRKSRTTQVHADISEAHVDFLSLRRIVTFMIGMLKTVGRWTRDMHAQSRLTLA